MADGDPDIYASNLKAPNCLYRNDGNGHFTDVAKELSVDRPLNSFARGFGTQHDGALDLMVWSYDTTTRSSPPTISNFLTRGSRTACTRGTARDHFRNVTTDQKLVMPRPPWVANFGDLDNDGLTDVYLGTGYQAFDALMPNQLYHNRRARDLPM